MATALQVIEEAAILIGALDVSQTINGPDADRGLTQLNRLLRGMIGTVIGSPLVAIGASSATTVQSGYRYLCDTSAGAITLTLPANPRDGNSFGATDANASFATHNLTLARNGHLIDDVAADVTLNTNGASVTYFFNAMSGWKAPATLALSDEVYLSADMIEPLTWMLAGRMEVTFTANTTPKIEALANEGFHRLQRKYGRKGRNQLNPPLGIVTPSSPNRTQTA